MGKSEAKPIGGMMGYRTGLRPLLNPSYKRHFITAIVALTAR
jgi:hypothetical protein